MTIEIIEPKSVAKPFEQTAEQTSLTKVAAYCRVSTDSDEQESSYTVQCEHYTEMITHHPGWELAGIYADEGISGTSTKRRAEFRRMIADCEAGKIHLILTKSLSRFARNTVDCLENIRKLKAMGVAVIFEKENINTLEAAGEMLITIMASFAQSESESISKNVRMGIQYRFQAGKGKLNTSVFLGLDLGESPGEWVIIPEEAEIVRRIFREFLEGFSPAAIGHHLEMDGIKTKCGRSTWYPSTIASMLENEKYCGDMLLQKYFVADVLTHQLKRNTGQLPQYYVRNSHDPIVPKEVFAQVQGELLRRSVLKNDPNRIRVGFQEALKGRLLCGLCGNVLKKYEFPDGTVDWRCRDRAFKMKTEERELPARCPCPIVRDPDAKEAILGAVNRLVDHRDQLIAMKSALHVGEIKRIDALLEAGQARVKQLETRKQALVSQEVGSGDPSNCIMQSEHVFLDGQIAALEAERGQLILERAEKALLETQVYILLELVDMMNTRRRTYLERLAYGTEQDASAGSPAPEAPAWPAKCDRYDEFFLRTVYRLPEGLMDEKGSIITFRDDMIIRYLDKVIVHENTYEVRFKGGLTITLTPGDLPRS